MSAGFESFIDLLGTVLSMGLCVGLAVLVLFGFANNSGTTKDRAKGKRR